MMTKSLKYIRRYKFLQVLYLFSLIIMSIKLICDYSEIFSIDSTIDSIINTLYIILMCTVILFQKYKIKEVRWCLILGVICLYSSLVRGDYYLIFSFFSIIGLKCIRLRKVIKSMFFTKVILLMCHFIPFVWCLLFNNGELKVVTRLGESTVRYTMFLNQPNAVAMLVMWTMFELIYLKYEKLTGRRLLRYWSIIFVIYIFTRSNTVLIIYTLISILIYLEMKQFKFQHLFVDIFTKYGVIFFSTIFIWITTNYNKLIGIFPTLADAFTGRLRLGAKTFDIYGWTMFGQYIDTNVDWDKYSISILLIDNFYISCFVTIGLVFLIIISICLWKVARRMDYKNKIFIIAFILFSVSEGYGINTYICFSLLLVADYLIK